MKLALFDFDGTISGKDSLTDVLVFIRGPAVFIFGMLLLSPVMLLYKFNRIPNWRAKEIMLGWFLKGRPYAQFEEECLQYSKTRLPRILKKDFLKRLAWHKGRGDKIAIVSASMENWLKDWCSREGFDLISTRLEVKDGILTGKLATLNCYGAEKVRRIREKYNLEQFDGIYAYGDRIKDREMLSLANIEF